MTESSIPPPIPLAAPQSPAVAAKPGLARCVPATAAGLLTAIAVSAGLWAVPTAAPGAADRMTSRVLAVPLTAAVPLAHPVEVEPPPAQPEQSPARDPFRPLLSPPDQATSAPAESPSVGAPQAGVPTVPSVPSVPTVPEPPRQVSTPTLPDPGGAPGGVPAPGAVEGSTLQLARVEGSGGSLVAVVAIDGAQSRVQVGDSFGPGDELLLLSIQQGPADGQWTAVVQVGRGEPFDLVTGTSTRLP